ncbi:MAG: hypothetical protein ABL956_11635 [Hyphomonadaceae bacterium]
MNGQTKPAKLEGVNSLGSLAVAFAGVAMVLYVMANGFGGGIA